MRYLKKTLLLILFIFSVFNWQHAAEAMEEDSLPDLVNRKIRSTQLIKAAAKNYYFHFRMKRYLSQGANINAQDKFGRTALHYAMVYLRYDVAEFLLKNGANSNKKDFGGCTPLMRLVQYSTPVAKSCSGLAELSWYWSRDKYGDKARNAIAESRNQTIDLLVEPSNCKSVIELLLQNGADPDAQDNSGKTALMYAGDNCWLVELLLKKAGTNPNIQDKEDGDTVLHLAAHRTNIERVQPLTHYVGDYHQKNLSIQDE